MIFTPQAVLIICTLYVEMSNNVLFPTQGIKWKSLLAIAELIPLA